MKIGRNDLCPCGSGLKYKKCCLADPAQAREVTRAMKDATDPAEVAERLALPIPVFRLKIELESMQFWRPADPVHRTVEMLGSDTLFDLHRWIQRAFGWDDDHLYAFYLSGKIGDVHTEHLGSPMGDMESMGYGYGNRPQPGSVEETELRDLGLVPRRVFRYRFDFGDELVHRITVSRIRDAEDGDAKALPRMIESVGESLPQYGEFERGGSALQDAVVA